jgi:hypothetical protein
VLLLARALSLPTGALREGSSGEGEVRALPLTEALLESEALPPPLLSEGCREALGTRGVALGDALLQPLPLPTREALALALPLPAMVYDLPANGQRLIQRAHGYHSTVLRGQITFEDGVATGALPGQLVRGQQRAR